MKLPGKHGEHTKVRRMSELSKPNRNIIPHEIILYPAKLYRIIYFISNSAKVQNSRLFNNNIFLASS